MAKVPSPRFLRGHAENRQNRMATKTESSRHGKIPLGSRKKDDRQICAVQRKGACRLAGTSNPARQTRIRSQMVDKGYAHR